MIAWREKHVKERNFVLFLSFLVGILTALAAYILKSLIHFIQEILKKGIHIDSANWLYLVYPIIGITLAGLFVRKIVKDDISHGVTKILYAISQSKARINFWRRF